MTLNDELYLIHRITRACNQFIYWDSCILAPIREEIIFRWIPQFVLPWLWSSLESSESINVLFWLSTLLFVILHFQERDHNPYFMFSWLPFIKAPFIVLVSWYYWVWNKEFDCWWLSTVIHYTQNHICYGLARLTLYLAPIVEKQLKDPKRFIVVGGSSSI